MKPYELNKELLRLDKASVTAQIPFKKSIIFNCAGPLITGIFVILFPPVNLISALTIIFFFIIGALLMVNQYHFIKDYIWNVEWFMTVSAPGIFISIIPLKALVFISYLSTKSLFGGDQFNDNTTSLVANALFLVIYGLGAGLYGALFATIQSFFLKINKKFWIASSFISWMMVNILFFVLWIGVLSR